MSDLSKPLVIGIVGGSGSGKTRLVEELRQRLPSGAICLVNQDNYYHPAERQLKDGRGVVNFDLPSAIDVDDLIGDLRRLLSGETVERSEYLFNNELREAGLIRMEPAPVILVEGLFVFHYTGLRQLIDLRVYVHAKENLKVIRRIKRDRVERNYPLEDVLYRYENHVLPTYEKYIKPYMQEADLVINNNRSFDSGVRVLAGFIRDHLATFK